MNADDVLSNKRKFLRGCLVGVLILPLTFGIGYFISKTNLLNDGVSTSIIPTPTPSYYEYLAAHLATQAVDNQKMLDTYPGFQAEAHRINRRWLISPELLSKELIFSCVNGQDALYFSPEDPDSGYYIVSDNCGVWSPDGRKMVQTVGNIIYLRSREKMDFIPIVDNSVISGKKQNAFWLPESDAIIFYNENYPNSGSYILKGIANVQSEIPEKISDQYPPQLSPNGKYLAFSFYEQQQEKILVTLLDGKIIWQSPDDLYLSQSASWAPDSNQIVFSAYTDDSTQENSKTELWIANIQDNSLKRLQIEIQNTFHPSWSPDGKYILFKSQHIEPTYDVALGGQFLYLFEVKTNKVTLIAHSESIGCVDWSPDNQRFLFDERILTNDIRINRDRIYIMSLVDSADVFYVEFYAPPWAIGEGNLCGKWIPAIDK